MNDTIEEKIEALLERVRPRLALHRGDVSFVSFSHDTGVVEVRMTGSCAGCPLSDMTLKMGIEALIVSELAEVTAVVAAQTHETDQ